MSYLTEVFDYIDRDKQALDNARDKLNSLFALLDEPTDRLIDGWREGNARATAFRKAVHPKKLSLAHLTTVSIELADGLYSRCGISNYSHWAWVATWFPNRTEVFAHYMASPRYDQTVMIRILTVFPLRYDEEFLYSEDGPLSEREQICGTFHILGTWLKNCKDIGHVRRVTKMYSHVFVPVREGALRTLDTEVRTCFLIDNIGNPRHVISALADVIQPDIMDGIIGALRKHATQYKKDAQDDIRRANTTIAAIGAYVNSLERRELKRAAERSQGLEDDDNHRKRGKHCCPEADEESEEEENIVENAAKSFLSDIADEEEEA